MFNNNFSSMSAILWCEQIISINIHDKTFLHTSKLSIKQLGYIRKYTNNSNKNRPIYSGNTMANRKKDNSTDNDVPEG